MSALDAGQGAAGIVWIHNGVAELKGGINWGAGNDTTGDGTATAPYLTFIEAMNQVRVFEGQELVTKDWEFRFLTDDDEVTDYGDQIWDDTGASPSVANPYIFIVRGWLKAWGDTDAGKWSAIDERPKTGRFERTSLAQDLGGTILRWVFKDLWIDSGADTRALYIPSAGGAATSGTAPLAQSYGCVFESENASFSHSLISGASSNVGTRAFVSCYFKTRTTLTSSLGGSTDVNAGVSANVLNCTLIPQVDGNALTTRRFNANGTLPFVVNCILAPKGVGSWAIENIGDNVNIQSEMRRSHNRYWLRDSAQFARLRNNGASDFAAFTLLGGQDDESSSGDPILVDTVDDPRVPNSSPILDKGGVAPLALMTAAADVSGNKFHEIDILNFPWGDSEDANTPVTLDGDSKWTHRAVGCHQNELGMVPGLANIVWPVGIIPVQSDYVAAPVNEDPDQNGTVQFRVLQADNAAMSVGLVIKDSCPLAVTASDNKINFKEDGGGELTATLTPGLFDTQSLMTEIKTQLEAAGTGTYTVTYDSGNECVTIAVAGAVTNVELLFASGTDVANSARVHLGFNNADTASQPSHDSPDKVLENFYDAALAYEYSSDYVSGNNPASSGTWNPVGTGIPSDSGVEGTDGVIATPGSTRFVRVNLGTTNPLDLKYHAIQFWNGTLKSQDEVI